MFRRVMGAFVALMLVATLLLPLASVGAQDEEIDPGIVPGTIEETIPETEVPPVAEEPPIVERQPEAPVVEEPIVQEPVVEEPVSQEPAVEEPVSEEPVAEEPVTEEPVTEPDEAETPSEPVDGEEPAATDDEETDEAEDETPDDPVDEAAVATVISGASLNCDGTLTFTIAEAAEETLNISFRNLYAPSVGQDMGSVSFPVTSTGTFQVSVAVADFVDVFQADISSPLAGGVIGQAAAYGCISGEEQTSGGISNMTLTCAGVTTFTIGAIDGAVSINLYDGSTNPHTWIDGEALGFIIDGGGESRTIDFDIPADTYDNLIVRARAHNYWAPLAIAYATDCVEDEPDPILPVVSNLTVDCAGLVTFDLETNEPVLLDVSIFIPAAAPGYRDTAQISAVSGPQQVQFDLPVRPYEWAATVSFDDELLADASVQGCPMEPLNTLPGSDVTVPVAGGTVTFENVLEPGETYITQLDPDFAPPLPAEFADGLVIMIDLSTTAVIDGVATVCLPIVGEVAEDAENVRLLHYENGAWVDITTSAGNGQVCGVTGSFSPFAIVHLADDDPGKPVHPEQPGKPSGPGKPGHHGQPNWHHAGGHASSGSGAGVTLTSLPNTGSGAQTAGSGAQAVNLLLCALALLAALGLRHSASRTRGSRAE